MKYWLITGGMVSLLLSCREAFSARDDAVGVLQAVSGQVNTAKKGSRFEIRLMGNPTTGYCWMLDDQASLKCVKFVSEAQVVERKLDGMVGGPAHPFVFTFDAVSPGEEKVVLVYKRSWEKKAPLKTCVFQINVTE